MITPRLFAKPRFGGAGGTLRVGDSTFSIPGDSEVKHLGLVAYVRQPHRPNEIHCFIDGGEIEVPRELGAALARRYFDQEDSAT